MAQLLRNQGARANARTRTRARTVAGRHRKPRATGRVSCKRKTRNKARAGTRTGREIVIVVGVVEIKRPTCCCLHRWWRRANTANATHGQRNCGAAAPSAAGTAAGTATGTAASTTSSPWPPAAGAADVVAERRANVEHDHHIDGLSAPIAAPDKRLVVPAARAAAAAEQHQVLPAPAGVV